MTYEEARELMLSISQGAWFTMQETVPDRPLTYLKPYYRVATFIDREHVASDDIDPTTKHTSWKKAINALMDNMAAEMMRQIKAESEAA